MQTVANNFINELPNAVCVHEAGYVLVATLLGMPPSKLITIRDGDCTTGNNARRELKASDVSASRPSECECNLVNCLTVSHAGAASEMLLMKRIDPQRTPEVDHRLKMSSIMYPVLLSDACGEDQNKGERDRLERSTKRLCVALLEEHIAELNQLVRFFSEALKASVGQVDIPMDEIYEQIGHLLRKYSTPADFRLACGHSLIWVYGGNTTVLYCDCCGTYSEVIHIVLKSPLRAVERRASPSSYPSKVMNFQTATTGTASEPDDSFLKNCWPWRYTETAQKSKGIAI